VYVLGGINVALVHFHVHVLGKRGQCCPCSSQYICVRGGSMLALFMPMCINVLGSMLTVFPCWDDQGCLRSCPCIERGSMLPLFMSR